MTQGSNLGVPHCRQILYYLSHQEVFNLETANATPNPSSPQSSRHLCGSPHQDICYCQLMHGFALASGIGFLCSVGKESPCNAGDLGLIPGLGRSPGERKGYPLQYSWASLVAQVVKNLPAMQETLVRFLGQENPLEKGQATHCSILGLTLWLS